MLKRYEKMYYEKYAQIHETTSIMHLHGTSNQHQYFVRTYICVLTKEQIYIFVPRQLVETPATAAACSQAAAGTSHNLHLSLF